MTPEAPDRVGGAVGAAAFLGAAVLVAALLLRSRQVDLLWHLAAVGAAALAAALLVGRALRRIQLTDPGARLPWRRPASTLPRPRPLEELEHAFDFARSRALDVHVWLRPHLAVVAAHRLASARGIDLEAEPEAARAVLGEELWSVLRPDAGVPDRSAPGLELRALAHLVDRLEEL